MVKLGVADLETMSLGELYDALAVMLGRLNLPRETPACFYSPTGVVAILALAEISSPPDASPVRPPTQAVALLGPELPYGVQAHAATKIETGPPRAPHTVPVQTLAEVERLLKEKRRRGP